MLRDGKSDSMDNVEVIIDALSRFSFFAILRLWLIYFVYSDFRTVLTYSLSVDLPCLCTTQNMSSI